MSNILSEISLHDIIYKLKDDNAVTQEQLEEALANIGNTSVVIQTEEPTDTSVIWIDPDDNNLDEFDIVKTVNHIRPDTNGNIQLEIEVDMTKVENHITDKNNPHEVTAEQIGAVTKEYVDNAIFGNIADITLLATNWIGNESPYTYTLAINGVTETSNQEVLPALNITKTQLEVLQAANIQDGGQTSGSLTLKAFGEIPVIDIPIRVLIRGGN